MDSFPEHNPEPTPEGIKELDVDELLKWIQQNHPKILKRDEPEKFQMSKISGKAFLTYAGDMQFFMNECNLSILTSETLANLAADIVRETAGYRQQVGDAETSNTASKGPRLESEDDDQLQELAASARRLRERIRQEIGKLDHPSISYSEDVVPRPKDVVSRPEDVVPRPENVIPPSGGAVSRPHSVFQLSNPTFNTKLPFPFVGYVVPRRFILDGEGDEENWFYTGWEKFTEVLDKFEHLIKDRRYATLTLRGTRGYSKSHLLAALVCYLAAKEKRVVYIPDCRNFIENPIDDMISAMLFAWADDESKQQRIMELNTQDDIYQFFRFQKNVIFVADQTNAFEDEEGDDGWTKMEKAEVCRWLQRCTARHKSILSSSTNNHTILTRHSNEIMYV